MSSKKDRRGRKVVALAAVAAVLGAGVYTTLASWNDNEWVVAGLFGDDGPPDLGTSTFNVQQNREQAPDSSSPFTDHATNADAGQLVFGTTFTSLSPGTVKYAPVALRTTADSLAGNVTLQAPVPSAAHTANDTDDLLWGALTYSVRTTTTPTACDDSTWATFGTDVALDVPLTAPLTAPTQSLAAAAGSIQYYCFAVTLPENPTLPGGAVINDLQGRAVHPAWNFASESVG